jgi:hypothetical protein
MCANCNAALRKSHESRAPGDSEAILQVELIAEGSRSKLGEGVTGLPGRVFSPPFTFIKSWLLRISLKTKLRLRSLGTQNVMHRIIQILAIMPPNAIPENVADDLSAAGWAWGYCSTVTKDGWPVLRKSGRFYGSGLVAGLLKRGYPRWLALDC